MPTTQITQSPPSKGVIRRGDAAGSFGLALAALCAGIPGLRAYQKRAQSCRFPAEDAPNPVISSLLDAVGGYANAAQPAVSGNLLPPKHLRARPWIGPAPPPTYDIVDGSVATRYHT